MFGNYQIPIRMSWLFGLLCVAEFQIATCWRGKVEGEGKVLISAGARWALIGLRKMQFPGLWHFILLLYSCHKKVTCIFLSSLLIHTSKRRNEGPSLMPNLVAYMVKKTMSCLWQWGSCQGSPKQKISSPSTLEEMEMRKHFTWSPLLKNPVWVITEGHFWSYFYNGHLLKTEENEGC